LLPVSEILAELHQQLATGDAIVVAPPGAGKSTYLPLSLLQLPQFASQKIIMLQPRRIAVRSIAHYLADQLGEAVGETIGYRIRAEKKVSANTRLEIVTEGILTRMLQNQPELAGIGLIIFDEFHERSIHADFSLALCLEVQQNLRDDLRLLIMSATPDVKALNHLVPQAKILASQGKSYPVTLHYCPDTSANSLVDKMTRLILQVFPHHQQDILVFLPGAGDIQKIAERLQHGLAEQAEIHCLYGELNKQQQLAALQPSAVGTRKIVLATNIAETSLTIEGIEVVIDSGLEKTAVFQLNRGITHLQTQKISQASATQRAGRAGRLGPGICYRLWSSEQQTRLPAQSSAEIKSSDIAPLMLESAVWGSPLAKLALLDQPSEAQLDQAKANLRRLGMFDIQDKLTSLGKQAQQLGCHPSIAAMLIHSQQFSQAHQSLACAMATLLENKDPLSAQAGAQLSDRLRFLLQQRNHNLWALIRQWHSKCGINLLEWPLHDCDLLLAIAFPQWLAKARQHGRYLLANGSGARIMLEDALLGHDWLIVAAMLTSDQQQDDALIRYAEPFNPQRLSHELKHLLTSQDRVVWDDTAQRVSAHRLSKVDNIVVSKTPLERPDAESMVILWADVIRKKGIANLPFNDACLNLLYRNELARQLSGDEALPDLCFSALEQQLESWLLPHIGEFNSWQQVLKCDFYQLLRNQFTWQQWQTLEQLCPSQYEAPTGRSFTLQYGQDGDVSLAVRIQEMYGLIQHPSIARGKLPITLSLLSPALRPVQTTQDLPGFWQGSYKAVQKEMKGRYPRHFWPDDPAHSPATTTTKKNMKLD
jgi:ATP-dependent helicase HrpB